MSDDGRKQAAAYDEWRKSTGGKACANWATLAGSEGLAGPDDFLRNRLWHAFHAGYTAGEKSSQFANGKCPEAGVPVREIT